jgi:hypothetical protein
LAGIADEIAYAKETTDGIVEGLKEAQREL